MQLLPSSEGGVAVLILCIVNNSWVCALFIIFNFLYGSIATRHVVYGDTWYVCVDTCSVQ